jgi:hypothetical protein
LRNANNIILPLIRGQLGLKRYRKSTKRDEEERKLLLDLGLEKMEEKEKEEFILVSYRRRKVKITCFS